MHPPKNGFPLSLADLSENEQFLVKRINAQGEVRRRLLDIGFVKLEQGIVVREALLRDPIEIRIKNTNVSLRRSEARIIEVERLA
jgi:Fe2+ transport system protein FeoA